jgi:undecaprenyl-diphosphatase
MNWLDWNNLTNWIVLYPLTSYLVVFLISLAESLAVVGLLVPGTLLLVGIGTLVSNGVLAWPITLVAAITGAIAGDGISYLLGRHYKGQIRQFWPFSRKPQLLQLGEVFFHRHGGKSVFLARFIGPVRPIVPLIAGMLNMSARQFVIVNIISAVCWACAYIVPGVVLGQSLRFIPAEKRWLGVTVAVVLVLLWIIGGKYRIYRRRKLKLQINESRSDGDDLS